MKCSADQARSALDELSDLWNRMKVPDGKLAIGELADVPFPEDAYCWDVYANRKWNKVHGPSIRPGYGGLYSMRELGMAYYSATFIKLAIEDALGISSTGYGLDCIPEVHRAIATLVAREKLSEYISSEEFSALVECLSCFQDEYPELGIPTYSI